MPINKKNQNWEVGQQVKVGFLSLRVTGLIPTPGDYRPDVYMLESVKGKRYTFTPYHGLEAIQEEGEEISKALIAKLHTTQILRGKQEESNRLDRLYNAARKQYDRP